MTRSPRPVAPAPRASTTRSAFDSMVIRDEFALVGVDRFVLFTWRTALSIEGVRAFMDTVRQRYAELGQSLGCAVYFEEPVDTAHAPAIRKEIVRGLAEVPGAVAASAMIRQGAGFPAATLRSSITSIQLEQGRQGPEYAHFNAIGPALEWLGVRLGIGQNHTLPLARMMGFLIAGRFEELGEGWGG